MEDFLEAIHSEESQSEMQKAFQFLDSCIDSALKKFTETTSSGRKYEAYDLVRHGPRARYEKVVRPRLPPKEA